MHHVLIEPGWGVYDANDEKVGEVADRGDDYVLVQKGLLSARDIFIPMSAIREIDDAERRVYVNRTESEIDQLDWDAPPGGSEYYATTRAAGAEPVGTAGNSHDTLTSEDRQRLRLHEDDDVIRAEDSGRDVRGADFGRLSRGDRRDAENLDLG